MIDHTEVGLAFGTYTVHGQEFEVDLDDDEITLRTGDPGWFAVDIVFQLVFRNLRPVYTGSPRHG